jgi:tetratricopeptide (TPR) repeat protein
MIAIAVALALLAAAPAGQQAGSAPAAAGTAAQPGQSEVDRAAELIGAGKPGEAVALLDTLIADQERQRRGETRQVFCARSLEEGLVYSAAADHAHKASIVLGENACYSLFLKGFALIDLNRSDEARAWLERAVAMAPSNAHFLGELAEWHKNRKDWATSRALFQRAVEASSLSPENRRVFDKSRGLRGLGYILIEEGKYDAAERLYRQCLALDPNDAKAKQQLDYIASQRGKKI